MNKYLLLKGGRLGFAAAVLLGATAIGCESEEDLVDGGTEPGTGGGGFLSGLFGGPGGTTGAATPGGMPGGTTPGGMPGGTTPGGMPGGTTPGGMPGGTTSGGGPGGNSLWCDAKAVLDQRCGSCHNGMGTGPMPLLTAADFKKPAPISAGQTVAQAVSARTHNAANPMPPRGLLAADELAALDAYIAAGAPAADNAACQPAGTGGGTTGGTAATWPPPGCDELVQLRSHASDDPNAPYVVPPRQEIHPQVMIDAPWGDETVQAIAFRPITDNLKVLHHWILYFNSSRGLTGGGTGGTGGATGGGTGGGPGGAGFDPGGGFITGWAPGDDDRTPYPPDVGMEMPKGPRSLRLDMHYYSMNETTEQNDSSGVEICIVKGANLRPKPAAVMMGFLSLGNLWNGFALAPANSANHESTGSCTVTASSPVTLMGSGPHAHKLATRTKFWVTKKDGTEVLLLDHPFKFGEQGSYPLTPHVVLETGDVVHTSCFYTNPTNQDVYFGMNTEDEMCFNFAAYYPKGALSCSLF
jgi:hypothetical protein